MTQDPNDLEQRIKESKMESAECQRVEEALLDSKRLLERTFASLHEAVFILDSADAKILNCNPAASHIFGYSREEMIGRNTSFLHVDEACLEEFRERLHTSIREKGSLFLPEFRMQRKDGTVFPSQHSVVPIEDEDGSRIGWVSIVRDITDYKRAEEALRQSEERYRWISENTADVIWVMDVASRRFKYVSPSVQKLRGYTQEEAMAQPFGGALTSECAKRANELLATRISEFLSGKPMPLHFMDEVDQLCKDGSIIHTEVTTSYLLNRQGQLEVIGVTRDITERKRAQEALRESERRSKRAAEVNRTMAELGRIISSTLSIDEVYEQCAQLVRSLIPFDRLVIGIIDPKRESYFVAHCSGYKMPGRERGDTMPLPRTVAEVERKRSGMLLEADEEKGFPEEYPSLSAPFLAGIRSTIIVPLISKDVVIGALFFGSVRSKAYKEDDLTLAEDVARQISGAIANAQLLMEYKRSEEALRRSRDELEARVRERTAELESKNRELQEFAFVASHDLSEPLRKIQTFGTFLAEKSADLLGEQERDFISRMTGAANRMQELLDALLRYSRVESKGQEFRRAELNDIVKDAAADLEVSIQKIGARVEITPLPAVTGDPSQLRQLFQNLIGNAVKYHRSEVKPIIKIRGVSEDETCRISVEDNGIGFDEKYLDKIFQPFQRLHGKGEYPGIGMGLAICKKIVERHKGTITAKSTPGGGSVFIVTFPAITSEHAGKE